MRPFIYIYYCPIVLYIELLDIYLIEFYKNINIFMKPGNKPKQGKILFMAALRFYANQSGLFYFQKYQI